MRAFLRGPNDLAFDMFDLARSADEAKRFNKCENIYHQGQNLAWNGKEVLDMLVAKHGTPSLDAETRHALQRVFAIILWGELAAWKISAQLADRLEPLEAKMAVSSQVHDEARHFYTMHDYLALLGEVPKKLDRAPRQLLNLILRTDNLAYKILGMQLMVETLALTIFQTIRLAKPEPVLAELMKYYERDEARHVGLGMQYLPVLMKDMNKLEVAGVFAFQARILAYSMWEMKAIEKDFAVLGIEARDIIDRGRIKQMVVMRQTFESLGIAADDSPVMRIFNFASELLFPSDETRHDTWARLRAAGGKLRGDMPFIDGTELSEHEHHEIVTARSSRPSRSKIASV